MGGAYRYLEVMAGGTHVARFVFSVGHSGSREKDGQEKGKTQGRRLGGRLV